MFPIEAFRATLTKIIDVFEAIQIRFHLTGGITTVAYGEPRMTQDVDLVVENEKLSLQIDQFVEALAKTDFMFDEGAVRSAVANKAMFQLLDQQEILKLDIYPRELVPGELTRSEAVEVFSGMIIPVVSRADAAASKLIWVSKGSTKSRRDLRQILRSAEESDIRAVYEHSKEFGLESLLDEILNECDDEIE